MLVFPPLFGAHLHFALGSWLLLRGFNAVVRAAELSIGGCE